MIEKYEGTCGLSACETSVPIKIEALRICVYEQINVLLFSCLLIDLGSL